MKKFFLFALAVCVLVFNPYTMNRYIRPRLFPREAETQSFVRTPLEYTPDRYVGALGATIVYYDGRNIRRLDQRGKELFSSAVRSDNFVMDIGKDTIFLLDKVRKKVYSINAEGEIIAQAQIESTPLHITALTGGRFALHYITDVKVEGLFIYDKSCQLLKDITYPKRSLNFVAVDGEKSAFLVSSLIRDPSMLKNNIYLYDSKNEATLSTDVDDSIFIKAEFSQAHIGLMDNSYVIVYDREFRPVCRISSESGLDDFCLTGEFVYTADASRKFRKYDLQGKLLEEKLYKEDIEAIKLLEGEPLLILRGGYVHKGEYKAVLGDLLDVILLEDRLALLFRDSIQYVRVQ